MFTFNYAEGATILSSVVMLLVVFVSLFIFNEFARRWKLAGFFSFVILPIFLTIMWMTALRETTYTDWFHLAKVYSSTAGCIGFWCIRHLEKKNKKTGEIIWKLAESKIALWFPPLILVVNILEAVARDIEVGSKFWMVSSGPIIGEVVGVVGGPWNYMNALAGILNIITITGWVGIVIRKQTKNDKSKDMLWPDMLWFWILAYDAWNFVYTYNCIPSHSWYAGIAMLLAPTLCAFTIGKGAWLQHRAQTLAIWCMFAQTFPAFQDTGKYLVTSTYNATIYTVLGATALMINAAVFVYMIVRVMKTKRNPYLGELYIDHKEYAEIKALAEN